PCGERILHYTLTDDGLEGPEVFCALEDGGQPDGLCFDEAGNLWIALNQEDCIVAYDERGRLVRRLDCPAGSVTSNCCFGGPDYRTLFVTCSGAGRVIAFATAIPGLPLYPFR